MHFGLRSLTFAVTAAATLLALTFAGCGDDGGSGAGGSTGTTTTTDGRYHPTPDGKHVTEKAACDALVDKQQDKLLDLHCVGTGQTCPSFLRAEFQTACLEYDQGSVTACIAYYDQQSTCEGLKAAIEACVVTAYPGTDPAGCSDISTGGTGGSTGGTGGTTSTGGSTSTGGTGGSTSTGGAGGSTSSGGTGGMTSTGGTGGV